MLSASGGDRQSLGFPAQVTIQQRSSPTLPAQLEFGSSFPGVLPAAEGASNPLLVSFKTACD